MSVVKKLEKTNSFLFFLASLMSKFQYIPYPIASGILRFVSLGLYMLAYGLGFPLNLSRPSTIRKPFILSSLIGFIATVLSVVAVFIPILFPPAACIFLLGNIFWSIGEYYKLKNPPQDDPQFSIPRQRAYLSYAITATSMSLVSATAAIIIFLFPPLAIPTTIFAVLLSLGLGAFAAEFWLSAKWGQNVPSPGKSSYYQIGQGLEGLSVSASANNLNTNLLDRDKVIPDPKVIPEVTPVPEVVPAVPEVIPVLK